MIKTIISQANTITLDRVIGLLAQSKQVEGLTLFGSTSTSEDAVSDYDLLILVSEPPVRIFQMQTYIDGRMADVAFVETDVAARVLSLNHPVQVTSDEGFMIGWMEQARVVYETTAALLTRVQNKVRERDWRLTVSESEIYHEWFCLNFDLRHIKRMAASNNPVYQTAADLHLMTNLAHICSVYFRVHQIHWRGAKNAVRHLQQHDAAYLALLRQCMAEPDRAQRIILFEQLVKITLEPVGGLWPVGSTGVYLKNPAEQPQRIPDALDFWENLIGASDQEGAG